MVGGSDSSPSSFMISKRTDIRYSVSDMSIEMSLANLLLLKSCDQRAAFQARDSFLDQMNPHTLNLIRKNTIKHFPLLSLLFFSHGLKGL